MVLFQRYSILFFHSKSPYTTQRCRVAVLHMHMHIYFSIFFLSYIPAPLGIVPTTTENKLHGSLHQAPAKSDCKSFSPSITSMARRPRFHMWHFTW